MNDYFVYLPEQTAISLWGCVATSVGFSEVRPGMPYPPHRHPVDHHFDWQRGRVLQRYVILLVSSGKGVFESASMPGSHIVKAGSVVLVFPGIWHRYKPAPETGWVEHWIECVGPVFDAALKARVIQPERALLSSAPMHDLLDCFARCHALAREGALARHDEISTLGIHILASVGRLQRLESGRDKKGVDEIVQAAQSSIALRCHEPLDPETLAAGLGVSYSHLRHSFRTRLGLSLKQYHLNTRLQRAQDLLASTGKPVKEIAEILGFESASHLSKHFKRRLGQSPKLWRRSLRHQPLRG